MKKQSKYDRLIEKAELLDKSVKWWEIQMKSVMAKIDEEQEKSWETGEVDEEKLEKLSNQCYNLLNKGRFEVAQLDEIILEINKYVKGKKK